MILYVGSGQNSAAYKVINYKSRLHFTYAIEKCIKRNLLPVVLLLKQPALSIEI